MAPAAGGKGVFPALSTCPQADAAPKATRGMPQEGRGPQYTALPDPPCPAPPLTLPAAAQFSAEGKKSFKAKVKQKPPELFLTIWLFWGRHTSRTAAGLPLCLHTQPDGRGPGPPSRAPAPRPLPNTLEQEARGGGILGIDGCVAPGSHARPRARGSGKKHCRGAKTKGRGTGPCKTEGQLQEPCTGGHRWALEGDERRPVAT